MVAAVVVVVVVTVTGVGGGSENGGSGRSQDGGRGCGARAQRLPGAVVRPLPPLRLGWGKGNYKSRREGRRGWWRGPLCAAGRGLGEGPTFFRILSFLAVTGFGDMTTTTRAQCGSGAFFVCGSRPRSS